MSAFKKNSYKVLGVTKPQACKKCGHERSFKLVEERHWLTFFIVPLIPYKKRNLAICSVCGAGYEYNGEILVKEQENDSRKVETVYNAIKERFENGEITKNEYIRMMNTLKYETQH